jgi:hypothetical protein
MREQYIAANERWAVKMAGQAKTGHGHQTGFHQANDKCTIFLC